MNVRHLIALRHLRSKGSHAVINLISRVSIVAMAVPVAAMVVLMSVFNGLEQMTRLHYTAVDADLKMVPQRGTTLVAEPSLIEQIAAIEGTGSLTLSLEQTAVIESGQSRSIATIRGVDTHYTQVVPIAERIVVGTFTTQSDERDCLVAGAGVINDLGLGRNSLGRTLSLYAISRARFSSLLPVGGFTRRDMPLTGIFALDESNAHKVFTSLRAAQELFNYPDRISAIEIAVAEGAEPSKVAERIEEVAGREWRVMTREESNSIYRLMAAEKWGVFFIAAIVLAIASLSIVGTLVMMIIDKRDDISTLRTMGMGRKQTMAVFATEGHIMALASLAIGLVAGIALTLLQQHCGIVRLNAASLMVDAYPMELQWGDVALTTICYLAVAWVITHLTVRRMLKE